MSQPALGTVVQHIHRLVGREPFGELSDAELLRRFLDRRDQGAFEALVWRHAALVLGVCRRLLRHEHDAEDAFQAAFLALAREGNRIRAADSVAGWLHRVAWRVARKLQARLDRRTRHETPIEADLAAVADVEPLGRDVRPILDEEVDRLPEKYRRAVILCYFQGKTNRQAAEELGCPASTLAARLAWARGRLKDCLTRRGVTLSAAGLAGLLEGQASAALPAASLVAAAVRGDTPGASAAMAAEVLRALAPSRARSVAAGIVVVALLVGGAGWLAHGTRTEKEAPAEDDAPAAAQTEVKEADVGPRVTGVVLDPSGKPVANATVRLSGGPYSTSRDVASGTADAAGRFRLKYPKPGEGERYPDLIARDAAGRIGWHQYLRPEDVSEAPLRLKLLEVADCSGRVVDDAGRPVAGARLVPRCLGDRPSRDRDSRPVVPPDDLREERATTTAADGSFTVRRLPVVGCVFLDLTADGFGTCDVSWDGVGPVAVRLRRAGAVCGRLTGTTDAKTLAALQLRLSEDGPRAEPAAGEARVSGFGEAKATADGTFRFDGVPPGAYTILAYSEPQAPFYAEKTPAFEVKPGRTADVAVALLPCRPVKGRVVDDESGAGLRGARVDVTLLNELNAGVWGTSATSGADGRYVAFVKPGRVMASVSRAPANYLTTTASWYEVPRLDAARESVYPDLALKRATRLKGLVLDAAGRPVAGAAVYPILPLGGWEGYRMAPVTADREGRFVLGKLDPRQKVPLRARAGDAVTDGPLVVDLTAQKEPPTLTVSSANAFRLRGRVVGPDGKPVRDAEVSLEWTRPSRVDGTPGGGWDGTFEKYYADAEGQFETTALWPGDVYQMVITAEGFGKAETARVQGRRGETHDLGAVALRRVDGVVKGRVLDAAGRPITGARVFNSGDAPRLVETVSDAAGRFALAGLTAGPVYVFADKAGLRFGGLRTATGAEVALTLRADGELPPVRENGPTVSNAERQRLARRLLEQIWALPPGHRDALLVPVLNNMGRIDPERSLLWSKEAGGRWDYLARYALAARSAETDVDEALAHAAPLPDETACLVLRYLAERYEDKDPSKALRFVEAFVGLSRRRKPLDQIWSLAWAGKALVRLGKAEAGRKLIDEAADLADKPGVAGLGGYASGAIAEALGPYDLPRARRLLEPVKHPSLIESYTTNLAVAVGDVSLAPTNLTKLRLAHKLAPTKPDEAVRLAESIRNGQERVAALALVAVRVAPKDRKLARELIDRAFDVFQKDSEDEPYPRFSYGGASVVAAGAAAQAREAGYPDMPSLVWRVLALRRPTALDSPITIDNETVATALRLALVDAAAARDLLTSVEPRIHTLGLGSGTIDRGQWFLAWALADPRRGAELLEKEIASWRGKPARYVTVDVVKALDALTVSPSGRVRLVLRTPGLCVQGGALRAVGRPGEPRARRGGVVVGHAGVRGRCRRPRVGALRLQALPGCRGVADTAGDDHGDGAESDSGVDGTTLPARCGGDGCADGRIEHRTSRPMPSYTNPVRLSDLPGHNPQPDFSFERPRTGQSYRVCVSVELHHQAARAGMGELELIPGRRLRPSRGRACRRRRTIAPTRDSLPAHWSGWSPARSGSGGCCGPSGTGTASSSSSWSRLPPRRRSSHTGSRVSSRLRRQGPPKSLGGGGRSGAGRLEAGHPAAGRAARRRVVLVSARPGTHRVAPPRYPPRCCPWSRNWRPRG